ncbi:MAG TPA: PadR family transcriptional regulator [Acidimicrobiales bacterium]|nr:PadR family transcriptional regulator [Acidimicrobiales bacterium]
MLELAILGLLKEQELHGYELKKRLGETLGPFSGASFGSLYPALRRLEAAGSIAASETVAASVPIPMTGSLGGELAAFRARRRATAREGGRKRKVYRITPAGERLFDELLATESQATDDDRTFQLKLAFARHLPPDTRLGLLERRRAHLVERLAQAKASVRSRRDRVDAYTRSLLEHSRDTTERDITWLDQLILRERAGGESVEHETTAPEPGPEQRRALS